MTVNQKCNVIEAIAYSRLVSKTFSTGECIVLHQWHNGHQIPDKALINKFQAVRKEIEHFKWEPPLMKYVEGGDLYYEDPESLTWTKIINN